MADKLPTTSNTKKITASKLDEIAKKVREILIKENEYVQKEELRHGHRNSTKLNLYS